MTFSSTASDSAARGTRSVAGVVFDMDGVLVDSEHLWEESWQHYCARHGRTWRPEDTAAVQGMSAPEWAAHIAGLFGDPSRADAVRAECVAFMVDALHRGRIEPLDGALDLIADVSERVPVALASSAARQLIDAVLPHFGVADRFSATVSSEEVPRGKPSPDVYAEAVRRLGIDPRHGLAVEDSGNGIRAAHAAGLTVIGIPNPVYPPKPDALGLAAQIAASPDDARRRILTLIETGIPGEAP
ncbi:haloacid dehalogenase [Actinomadura sp. NBRC 104425]|uniref:HAD family hydrolase n=1 Tax=Actinomadura sp. NBRC 104425 TaxID=3032204 RepID=UPI0024A56E6F|nr:HAD family phosphatase [Actinomadura sp. NBRC 104425]GLZ13930.1 haloacid dehalogenase [Actinomadura sp. NBRC 104425]